jgi:hypothetical protein
MKKLLSTVLLLALSLPILLAKEGMWIPLLLKSMNEEDMQSMGLKLSAEDIYSINQSSLKDAVISFGGFCTGEIISDKGLILTNHHCGYGQIQSHSSVENDYLSNGYWAKSLEEELPNPGLSATFIVRIEDVTEGVLGGLAVELSEEERQKSIQQRIDSLVAEKTEGTPYGAYIRPFFYGNEYYLFITETFKDVRLVGAPPSSIGKFGGDTDNWMWPRHTGDFSLFRIYADTNNQPAEYSENNVPYKPKHFFPISMGGVKEGDFTMVFGFPGRTQEYLTSYAIQQIKEVINPAQIAIREKALGIMDRHMKVDDKVRIQYASKYARISNYWKKWIGENNGLQKSGAIERKKEQEKAFVEAVGDQPAYTGLMGAFEKKYTAIESYALARSYFVEIPYRKVEIIGLAATFRKAVDKVNNGEALDAKELESLKVKVEKHFKDYDLSTDQELAENLLWMYKEDMPKAYVPPSLAIEEEEKFSAQLNKFYERSLLSNKEATMALLTGEGKGLKKLSRDPFYSLMTDFWGIYFDQIRPTYNRLSDEIDSLSKIYVKGLRDFVPGKYYPDANSTLRLAYGKVEDFKPRDGVQYDYFTNVGGILEKYDPDNVDFNLPPRLVELIRDKDFGPYQDKDGLMHVCFIASNHTTGGNSGSPVINGKGELIGLNFDRNWEGTMSDINYDIDQCRNIAVDIRYVLFVVDKFAGAKHLIQELNLVNAN